MSTQTQYTIIGKFTGVEAITGGFRRIYDEAGKAGKRIEESARASDRSWRTHQTTLSQISAGYSNVIGAGREVGYIWRHQAESLREYVDEAMRLNRAQEKFKTLNLSPQENAEAFDAVKKTIESIKGLNLVDTTETLSDAHTAVGDLHHAISLLPLASKFRFGFETIFGDKFNKEQLEEQVQAGMKYLEVTGAIALGEEETKRRFNVLAQMTAGSIGRTTPAMMLQMARRAGPAAQGLSVEGMRNMSGLVQELSGEGAGTALMSLYQSLVNGVMKQSAATEFMRLGLLDPHKIIWGNAQKIKSLMPNANKLGVLMQEDPLKAADALMEAMKHPLKGPAIDTTNMNKVRAELGILFGNRTAQKMMSILTTQRGQVVKEAGLASVAKDIQQTYDQALGTPAGKLKEFENTLANFRAEVGGPLVNALTDVGTAAMPLMNLAAQHPQFAFWAIMLLKIGSASAQTAAAIRMTGIIGLLKALFSAGMGGTGVKAIAGAGGALTKEAAEALLFGTGAKSAATAAGAGVGASAAAGLGTGLAIGLVAMIPAIIQELNRSETDSEAEQAGDRIGKYLAERFKQQIEGKLAPEVQKELDKAQAPALAKDIIKQQGLGTAVAGIFTPDSDFVKALKDAALVRTLKAQGNTQYFKKDPDLLNVPERLKSQIYNSGIRSAEQLSEYLKQAYEILAKGGKPELYNELEKLARESLTNLTGDLDKLQQVGPASDGAAQGLQRLALQLRSFVPYPGGPPPPPSGGYKFHRHFGTNTFGIDHRNFSYAGGGIGRTPQLATFAEHGPEVALPMEHYRTLHDATKMTEKRAPVEFHYAPSISFPSEASAHTVATFSRMLEDHKNDILRLLNDTDRDVALGM